MGNLYTIEERIEKLEKKIKELSDEHITSKELDNRLDSLENTVNRLENNMDIIEREMDNNYEKLLKKINKLKGDR